MRPLFFAGAGGSRALTLPGDAAGMSQPRILSVTVSRPEGLRFADYLNPPPAASADARLTRVHAVLDDGREQIVLRAYGELTFTPEQFVGLSSDGVAALYFATDEAFLQTHPRARSTRAGEFTDHPPHTGPLPF